jgi:hypothetical protein
VSRTSSAPPLPPHLLLTVQARRVLGRAAARRLAVVLVAVVTGVLVASLARSADAPPLATRSVVVAERDLAPGDLVAADAVVLRKVPAAGVADAATDQLPVGSVVRYPIAAGEPVVPDRLAPEGLSGAAALVPEGYRAVGLPVGPAGTPPVHPGDRVDVVTFTYDVAPLAFDSAPPDAPATAGPADGTTADIAGSTAEPDEAEPIGPAMPLAEQALVVDTTDTTVTVAVPTPLAPAVAWASAQGLVALTLVGA